jgi:hypothetical protein
MALRRTNRNGGEKMKPGDRVAYRGLMGLDQGILCDFKNLVPPPKHPLAEFFDMEQFGDGTLAVVLFDGNKYRGLVFDPYYVMYAKDLRIIGNAAPRGDLKYMNMDGRAACAACGGPISEPWPGLRHCPKCEP